VKPRQPHAGVVFSFRIIKKKPSRTNSKKEHFMKNLTIPILAVITLTMLSACGENTGERALSGGAIGAGAGTVGAVILGADPITGAVLGGAVGAGTGAITKKKDINLGKPAWK